MHLPGGNIQIWEILMAADLRADFNQEVSVLEKCIRLFALIASKIAKFHSNQLKENQSTAKNAILNIKSFN